MITRLISAPAFCSSRKIVIGEVASRPGWTWMLTQHASIETAQRQHRDSKGKLRMNAQVLGLSTQQRNCLQQRRECWTGRSRGSRGTLRQRCSPQGLSLPFLQRVRAANLADDPRADTGRHAPAAIAMHWIALVHGHPVLDV